MAPAHSHQKTVKKRIRNRNSSPLPALRPRPEPAQHLYVPQLHREQTTLDSLGPVGSALLTLSQHSTCMSPSSTVCPPADHAGQFGSCGLGPPHSEPAQHLYVPQLHRRPRWTVWVLWARALSQHSTCMSPSSTDSRPRWTVWVLWARLSSL